MQNGDDFYIIDMALADNSALNDCVPKGMLKKTEENWIPKLDSNNPEIYVSPEDICVCCGRPVPEGTMLCWTCAELCKIEVLLLYLKPSKEGIYKKLHSSVTSFGKTKMAFVDFE